MSLLLIILLAILIIFCYHYYYSKVDNFYVVLSKKIKRKKIANKKTKIPLTIYQTHKSNDLPVSSYNNIIRMIKLNPEFNYQFFDDNEMRNYIKSKFNKQVLKAYDKIKPGAGKADIWRLAIILKEGGLYIDLDKILVDNAVPFIDIIDENEKFIHGRNWYIWGYNAPATNATLCAVPNHPVIKDTFNSVIDSILNDKPLKYIGKYKGWAKLENYTGTPHLWKTLTKYTGNVNMKEGYFDYGITISNKLEDNLKQNPNYGYDLKELNAKHWSTQEVFNNSNIIAEKFNYKKIIIQTYHDKSKIPEKVFNNIKKHASGYKHVIFDDNECIKFLKKFYPKKVVNKFNSLKLGAHKADLFRYCYLYLRGGLYLDIKTVLVKNIDTIFTNKDYIYTVFSVIPKSVFQGIIYTPPKQLLFKNLINRFLNTTDRQMKNDRVIFTKQFYQEVLLLTGKKKLNVGLNNDKYFFYKEVSLNKKYCNNKLDRWNGCYWVVDENNNKIIKIRFEDFPW